MTSPAPQPAPLRPGQRAAKPKAAKSLTPRQSDALALLDKPGAYATIMGGGAFILQNRKRAKVDWKDIVVLRSTDLAKWVWSNSLHSVSARAVISPAGRAALRAGSRGGRGRR